MPVTAPDPSLAPKLPTAYELLDEVIRSDLDPDRLLGDLFGWTDPSATAPDSFVVDGWTVTEIDGLQGLADMVLWLLWQLRQGRFHDPRTTPPEWVDRVALARGVTRDLIDIIRNGAADVATAESWIRKVASLAPLLWAWKGTRSGGGEGGLYRAVQALTANRPRLLEVFAWQSPTIDDGGAALVQLLEINAGGAMVGWGSVVADIDFDEYDVFAVNWPTGGIVVDGAVEEMIRLSTTPEVVHYHPARWVDEFLDDGGMVKWVTDLQSGDAAAISPPDPRKMPPEVSPIAQPGGSLVLACSATAGERWVYPRTADHSVHGDDCHSTTHIVDVFVHATGVASPQVLCEVTWDSATDGGYRIELLDGDVTLMGDAAGPVSTVMATATKAYPAAALSNALSLGVRLTVTVSLEQGRTVRVYVDGELVITYVDGVPVIDFGGSVRFGCDTVSQTMTFRQVMWKDNAPPVKIVPT